MKFRHRSVRTAYTGNLKIIPGFVDYHRLLNTLVSRLTGKSLSEALILASTNPQYDKRLSIELQVQYMKITTQRVLSL